MQVMFFRLHIIVHWLSDHSSGTSEGVVVLILDHVNLITHSMDLTNPIFERLANKFK